MQASYADCSLSQMLLPTSRSPSHVASLKKRTQSRRLSHSLPHTAGAFLAAQSLAQSFPPQPS